ncbi:MAG: hypothetical protein E6Q98_24650 [Rhodospirillaceae bacterium]|nr:MAG: hypothetical protein E6Q98_24650 [Rhodospirillaceae bacterium]
MKIERRLELLGTSGLTPARLVEAVEVDLIALRDQVQAALRDLLKLTGDGDPWPFVSALYADSVIVDYQGKTWRYPYEVVGTGITFGAPVEVVRAFVPAQETAPATIPATTVPAASAVLIEAVDGESPTPKAYRVRVIRAGRSGNGNYYPAALLREAAPMFEGVRVFVKSDSEHTQGGGKDVRNLVGALSQAKFIEGAGPDDGEIQAVLTLIIGDQDPTAVKLREAVSQGLSHIFGLSIDAAGTAQGVKGNRVAKSFLKIKSVDLIVEPGAGGQVISFVEAIDNGDFMDRAQLIALIQEANPALLEGKDLTTLTDEVLQGILKDALKKKEDPAPAGNDPAPADLTEAVGNQFRMRDIVNGSKLPKAAKDKLIANFTLQHRFTEAQVTDAIKSEIAYLTEARGGTGGQVADLGDVSFIEAGEGRREKIAAMLDAFFDPAHKDHRDAQSFRECYIEITGDQKVTGRRDQSVRLTEALGSEDFASVLGDAMTRRMVADYRSATDLDFWRLLTGTPVRVNDFRDQQRVRFGGYGDLPAVAEKGTYQPLDSPTDEKATYAVSKRGGLETVTLEMIKNDDVGAIMRIPTRMSRAAKRTLCKFVMDFVRNNAAIYDTKALFHADHGNLGTAALSAASWAAARLAMMKQAEMDSGEPLGIGPKTLFIAAEQEETAYNLFQRSTNLDKTFVQTLVPTIVPVFYWTDANDWVAAADPLDIPSMEIGFLDGNEEPEMFVQDSPTSGSLFTNDQVTYKIRHIYGGGIIDYRGLYKAVVANA